jgi:hypothetical protein
VLWSAALVGLVRALWSAKHVPIPVLLLPFLGALSHFAIVVIFLPHIYGDRLILPLYPLLIPYAAAAVSRLPRVARAT